MRNFPTSTNYNILSPPRGQENRMLPLHEAETVRQLRCDVVFGSPSADCMGTGICRISARTEASASTLDQKGNCRTTAGILFPIEGGNGVSIVLTRAMLCANIFKNHLRQGSLSLESDCHLPMDVVQSLGLKFNYLSIGKYPIREYEGLMRIDFRLPR
jgi:hypothetical protein